MNVRFVEIEQPTKWEVYDMHGTLIGNIRWTGNEYNFFRRYDPMLPEEKREVKDFLDDVNHKRG